MSLLAKKTGNGQDIPPIDSGTYHAVCYLVVDLGTQYNAIFDHKAHKVVIGWEIPELRIQWEKDNVPRDMPRAISKIYTLSLHEKSNLTKDLICWRGRAFTEEEEQGFDILSIIGANCILQVIQTKKGDKTYANVVGVSKMMKNMQKVKPENATVTYSMETNGLVIPETLPDWMRDIIRKSEEYRGDRNDTSNPDLEETGQASSAAMSQDEEDDIPF